MGWSPFKSIKDLLGFSIFGASWLPFSDPVTKWWLDLFKPKKPDVSTESGVKENYKSTNFVIPVVYGTRRVGGNVVYMTTTGKHNKYLHMVVLLAQGECSGIHQETIGGTLTDQIFLDDLLWTEYGDTVEYTFKSGGPYQSVVDIDGDDQWQDTLRDYCYLYIKLTWDARYYKRVPKINVILKGKLVYNPVTGITEYSENAVHAARDFMTNSRYGWGVPTSMIDDESFGSVATYFDSKDWAFSKIYNNDGPAHDVVQDILRYSRASLVWDSAKYYLYYADTTLESSVMDLSYETNIIDGSETITAPSRFSSVNRAEVTWVDAERKYVEDKFYILATTQYTKAGDFRDLKLDLTGCGGTGIDPEQAKEMAQELGTYYLERAYTNRGYSLKCLDEAIKLQPHDLVQVTSDIVTVDDLPGWENKLFRVSEHSILDNDEVALSLVEETDLLYDDTVNVRLDVLYDLNFPDPFDPPPPVSGIAHSEETFGYRGRRFTRWKIQFDRPVDYPWFKHVEVWYSENGNDPVTPVWEFLYNVETGFNLDNVFEGQTYWIALRVVNIYETKQDPDFDRDTNPFWTNSQIISREISGWDDYPQSLVAPLYAIVGDNAINLYANPVDDEDIEWYEFRLFAWAGGMFLGASRAPQLSLKMVKPGSHSFYLNTLSNNDEYGEVPIGVTVNLPNPPLLWNSVGLSDVGPDDFTTGTHFRTYPYDVGGTPYLRRYRHGSSSSSSESSSVSSASSSLSSESSESSSSSSSSESSSSSTSSESSSSSGSSESSSSSSISSESSSGSSEVTFVFVSDDTFRFAIDSYFEWVDEVSSSSESSASSESSLSSSVSSESSSSSSSSSESSSSSSSSSVSSSKSSSSSSSSVSSSKSSSSSSSSSESSSSSSSSESSSSSSESSSVSSESSSSSSTGPEDLLTGHWTSVVHDLGDGEQNSTYLVWVEANITVLGGGTYWVSQFPDPATWAAGNITRTWGQIFALTEAGSVKIEILHSNSLDGGALSNPHTISKLEILGTMFSARYFQVKITIIDPNESVSMLVEQPTVKFKSPT